jgi:HSP20 family protein
VDVTETDREIVLKGEVPGMEQGDIDVSFRKGILTIRGERKEETEERRGEMRRVERRRGSFERSFHIPMDVDVENAKAEYSKGILTVKLPKVETDGARKIEVKAA